MEVAKATRTALMAGTLLTQSQPLNNSCADPQAHAAARPGRSIARAAPLDNSPQSRRNLVYGREDNPASELELPRLEHRLPKHVLTASEAEAVLSQPDTNDALGVRDRAILETLYSTGMRRMEVVNLGLFDLDLERGTLMVRQGKGKKDRIVPIGERAAAWIEKYRADIRPQLVMEPDCGTLFLAADGERFSPNGMTAVVRGYVVAADLGKRGACLCSGTRWRP